MKLIDEIGAARRAVDSWSRAGERVALVPTMGNLHDGHIQLLRVARRHAERVVVSIFVNPTQFGPQEDFAAYPRTLAADRRRLASAGADAVFVPSVRAMYPGGARQGAVVSVPALAADLCGKFRPGHFDGVCSVVLRLFNILTPAVAVFGEKDFQQLTILRRMAADLYLPVKLVGAPTARERDGLAMSSRNQYLTSAERAQAPRLHAILRDVADQICAGRGDYGRLERAAVRRLAAAGFRPDYVSVRDSRTLARPGPDDFGLRVLAAAWLGRARLIDNLAARRSRG